MPQSGENDQRLICDGREKDQPEQAHRQLLSKQQDTARHQQGSGPPPYTDLFV
jgi:hypothetical protein